MKPSSPTTCLNCGTTVADRFCPRCGQAVEDRRQPLRRLLHDFLGETLSLESRLFRGLRDLFFRPGLLTESFLAGRRASQLPPMRLYLVASLFFFFLFSLTPPDVSNLNVFVGDQLIGREAPDPEAGNWRFDLTSETDSLLGGLLGPRLTAKEEELRQMDPQMLVNAVFNGIGSALPKALILFLPLLALLLKLLYLGSGLLYFDHCIFALHLQAFLFFLFSLSWFVPLPAIYWLVFFVAVVPGYTFLAMRRVYRQRPLWIALKTGVLSLAYLVVLAAVFSAMLFYVLMSI